MTGTSPCRCAALVLGALLLTSAAGAQTRVWLDELDVSLSRCGWQRTLANQSVGGNPLRLDGTEYPRGVGTHAPGAWWIELGGRTTRFHAVCGIDDEMGDQGSVEFSVVGDGRTLWTAGVLGTEQPVPVELDVTGVRMLCLTVATTPDGYAADHADWCDAWVEMAEGQPRAVPEPPLTAYEEAEQELAFFRGRGLDPRFTTQAYRVEATVLPSDRDGLDVVLRRTRALAEHLRRMEGGPGLEAELAELSALDGRADACDPSDRPARQDLCVEADALRTRIAFRNPLLSFDRILFLKRHFLPGVYSEGDHMCDQYFGFHALPGGGLFVLEDPFTDHPVARDLLAGTVCESGRLAGRGLSEGGFLAPDLSFDAKEIVFAWTEGKPTRYEWSEASTYHLFRVGVDGTGLRQLTDGAVNDVDPCWLPDGGVAFISERRGGFGRCHGRPVPTFTLHTMDRDGGGIACISPHETNEWQPSVDRDGMLLYTRWDYVDRGFNQAHHPWNITPDGRDARAVQGNYGLALDRRPQMEMDLRAIPGSRRLISTAAAHHSQAYGSLVIIDPVLPDDDAMGPLRRLTPEVPFPEAESPSSEGQRYASPWPLDETFTLCVYDPQGAGSRGTANRFGIYLLDAFGNKVLVYRDPAISCSNPIPLRPRAVPPTLPRRVAHGVRPEDLRVTDRPRPTGEIGVVNVYDSLLPLPAGTRVTALRVIEVLPKTSPIADDPFIGYGSQKGARKVLGTVPVEDDGSAWFTAPAGRPIFFQALDSEGLAIQAMRSETWVQPGDTLVCQGCHNPRGSAPANPRVVPLALRRAPSPLQPEVDGANPFSFPRLVQPVLDRHCVSCHGEGGSAPDLRRGDVTRNAHSWFTSYTNLRDYAFFYGNVDWTEPRTVPGRYGARASRLYALLKAGHHEVRLAPEEMRRLTLWLDCNSDFFGAYTRVAEQARGEVVTPELE